MILTKDDAIKIIRQHLIKQVPHNIEIKDGVPESCVFYGVFKDESCWTAWIPPELPRTGPSRIVCISKKTGRIIYDGFTNE